MSRAAADWNFDLDKDNLGATYGTGPFVNVNVSRTDSTHATITFTDSGFTVKRTWSGDTLGIPANLGGLIFSADGNALYVVGAADTTSSGPLNGYRSPEHC